MSDYTVNESYSPRQGIRRYAFAVRHMLLEEIKRRRFELRFAPNIVLEAQLVRIARGLVVEQSTGHYIITVEGRNNIQIETERLYLYTRGDTLRFAAQQDILHLRDELTPDLAYEQNEKQIIGIVNSLLEQLVGNS